jgi:hypothetical protein
MISGLSHFNPGSETEGQGKATEYMAHSRLYPESGQPFLSSIEAINRLHSEFGNFHADRKKGAEYVGQMLQQLNRMRSVTPPPATNEQIARLEALECESIFISICSDDDPGGPCLTTCIIPGEPLFFGFSSDSHQEATLPLLIRCASALGYLIE